MKLFSAPDSFAKGSVFITISQIVFLGVGYVLQVFFAKTLSPNEYGILGTTLSALNIAELIFAAGILLNISSWISRAPKRAGEILYAARRVQTGLVAVLMVALLALAPFTDTLFKDESFPIYFALLAVFLPVYGIRAYYTSVLSGYKRFASQFVFQFIATFIKLLAIPLVLFGLGVLGILIAYILSNAVLGVLYFLQARKIHIATDLGTEHSRKAMVRSFVASVPPLTVFTFFFSAILSVDLFFVRALLEDTAQSGLYVGAGVIPRAILILFSGLMMVLVTFASKPLKGDTHKKVQDQFHTMVSAIALVMIPATLFSIPIASDAFEWLFTAEYAAVGILAPFFLLAATSLIVMRLLIVILVAQERFTAIYPLIGFLLLDVALLPFAISSSGILGAAVATTIVSVVGLTAYTIYVRRSLSISLPWKRILLSVVAAGIPYGLVAAFYPTFFELHFILVALVLFLVYGALLVAFKVITPQDIRALKQAFSNTTASAS